MQKLLKLVFTGITSLLVAGNFFAETNEKSSAPPVKGIMTFLAVEGPRGIWKSAYGDDFPAKELFRRLAEAGYTDILLTMNRGRGLQYVYHNSKYAPGCPQMADRDWLEEALTEADEYKLNVWLMCTPGYKDKIKVSGTDIVTTGLDDPRHVKIWTDILNEIGENYKSRHPSLAGVYLHEVNCAEAANLRNGDLDQFSAFCQKNFGEKYTGEKMPDGNGGTKWDKRFFLYKNSIVTDFIKVLRDTAAKYDMKTIFCLYSPEYFASNSALWGYDTLALEKLSDGMWTVIQAEYRNLKGGWQDTGQSYTGSNIPCRETMAFHGKPLSSFEARVLLFPEELRKFYGKSRNFTKTYGDYLTGFLKKSEKVIELFTGVENVKKWNNLHKKWIGAKSQAKIALMAASVPFVIRFPSAPGTEYKKAVTELLTDLKKRYPTDLQLTGSEYTLKPENLLKYDLIIIPAEMGIGMDEAFFGNLKNYLADGGKVLALGTSVTTGSSDLEEQTDHMEELFGVKIKPGKRLPGYISLESGKLTVPAKKIWCELYNMEAVSEDEVIIHDRFTRKPVLTRKGNAYYLACTYDRGQEPIIAEFINKYVPQHAYLAENNNFSFSSITRNDNMLCVALPCERAASAILSVDAEKFGISGEHLEVRNIITGRTVANVRADELKKGIRVKTDYDSEPYVLAIGTSGDLKQFKGLYPDNTVFTDMGKIDIVENPEVAIAVPDKPGIKVGIYQNALGAEEIYRQLIKMPEFNCFYLPRLDGECMAHADVIVIPQAKASIFFENAMNVIKDLAGGGKGFILTHDTAVKSKEIFPGIVKENKGKIMAHKDNKIRIQSVLDSAAPELQAGDEYLPGFAFDHYAFTPGEDARVIGKDAQGNDVILAGRFQKGKVVLFGTLPGEFSTWNEPALLKDKKLEGKELRILVDSVKWAADGKK